MNGLLLVFLSPLVMNPVDGRNTRSVSPGFDSTIALLSESVPRGRSPASGREADERTATSASDPSEGAPSTITRLTSEILRGLSERAGGDPARLQEILKGAQANPAAFAEGLAPHIRERFRSLASELAPGGREDSGP